MNKTEKGGLHGEGIDKNIKQQLCLKMNFEHTNKIEYPQNRNKRF